MGGGGYRLWILATVALLAVVAGPIFSAAVELPGRGVWAQSAPGAPTAVTLTSNSTEIEASWTAPSGTITDYDVQYKLSSASNYTDASYDGTATNTTITGLTNGSKYDVQVRAENSSGNSDWSTVASVAVWLPTAPGGRRCCRLPLQRVRGSS